MTGSGEPAPDTSLPGTDPKMGEAHPASLKKARTRQPNKADRAKQERTQAGGAVERRADDPSGKSTSPGKSRGRAGGSRIDAGKARGGGRTSGGSRGPGAKAGARSGSQGTSGRR